MSNFQINQLLHSLSQPGTKTQQEVDFGQRLTPFVKCIIDLPVMYLFTMDVEARRVKTTIDGIVGKQEYEWQVCFVGAGKSLPVIARFGDGVTAEYNAKTIVQMLNAVKVFRQSIGV